MAYGSHTVSPRGNESGRGKSGKRGYRGMFLKGSYGEKPNKVGREFAANGQNK